jgi:hypothetical protein
MIADAEVKREAIATFGALVLELFMEIFCLLLFSIKGILLYLE